MPRKAQWKRSPSSLGLAFVSKGMSRHRLREPSRNLMLRGAEMVARQATTNKGWDLATEMNDYWKAMLD